MEDKLTVCGHCGRNACYEQHVSPEVTTWLCLNCGFTTTTALKEGSPVVEEVIQKSPSLYRDLMHTSEDGHIWVPANVTVPNLGMVFLDGSTAENWQWVGVKAIPLTKEERRGNRYPKKQTHKMDTKNMKGFGKDGFLQAFEYAGFLGEE